MGTVVVSNEPDVIADNDPSKWSTNYERKVANPDNRRLRTASGAVDDGRAIVALLYLMMRDGHIAPGDLETMVREINPDKTHQFTNGWLANYAADLADRLGPSGLDRIADGVAAWLEHYEIVTVNRSERSIEGQPHIDSLRQFVEAAVLGETPGG